MFLRARYQLLIGNGLIHTGPQCQPGLKQLVTQSQYDGADEQADNPGQQHAPDSAEEYHRHGYIDPATQQQGFQYVVDQHDQYVPHQKNHRGDGVAGGEYIRLFPEKLDHGPDEDESQDQALQSLDERTWYAVPAAVSGYVQSVDDNALLSLALDRKTVVRMERGVGGFVVQNTALASLALTYPRIKR